MTQPSDPPSSPISVKPTVAPVVMSEGTKFLLVCFFAVLCDHFIRSESVKGVVLTASGAFATFIWGLWHRIRCWTYLKFLTGFVDDSIARIGK